MPKEQTMESMLAQAQRMEDEKSALNKKAMSEALNWGLKGLQQAGGALSAYGDASAYTGFEEAGEAKAISVTTAAGRLAQGDIMGAMITLFRGEELYMQERRQRQKEKQLGLKNQLRELRRGKEKDERDLDRISREGIEKARDYAQETAFASYGQASGVKGSTATRRVRGSAVRAQAAAEAPAKYLAARLDELADVERILGREHDEALKTDPGRLKYQDELQAAIDDVMRFD